LLFSIFFDHKRFRFFRCTLSLQNFLKTNFVFLGEALVATNDVIVTVTAAPEIYQPAPVTAAPSVYQPVVYFTEKPAVAEPVVFFTQKPAVAEPVVFFTQKPAVAEPVVFFTQKPAVVDQVVYFTNQPAVIPIGPAVRPAYDQVPVVVSVFVTL
jgi:hypothetical protein